MQQAGVETGDDAAVLRAVVEGNYNTLLSVWKNAVPDEVQESIDNYEFPNAKKEIAIRPETQADFPELSPLIEFANKVNEIHQETTGQKNTYPLIMAVGPNRKSRYQTLHRDPYKEPLSNKISTLCVMHSSDAEGGEFEYVAPEDADRVLQIRESSSPHPLYDCTDESAINKVPLNSVFSFVCDAERGLAHRGTPTQYGTRWVIDITNG